MKTITLTILAACLAGLLFAQEAPKKSSFKTKFAGKKIVLRLEASQVSIEGYSGDEIIIEAENAPQMPAEAKGLRPLSAGGTDNTGLGIATTTTNGIMTISTVLRNNDSDEPTKYKFRIPRQLSVSYGQSSGWCNCDETVPITIKNIDGEVNIKTNELAIELTNVTGPIVAKSNSGAIKAIYDDKISDKPSSFVSYQGNIDIAISDKAKIIFGVNTDYGNRSNVFTDLDLKVIVTSEKKDDKKTKLDISFSESKPPAPPKPPKVGDARIIASRVAINDTTNNTEISITDSTGSSLKNIMKLAMDLNQMGADRENDELSELSDLNTANDFEKKSTSYVLNEAKTKISIRTLNGNVFLRKK